MLYLMVGHGIALGRLDRSGFGNVSEVAERGHWFDRLAIGLSGLCLAHCIASAVLVALLASAGGILLHHSIHEAGLVLAIAFAVLGLGRGIRQHGFMMPGSIGGLGIGVMAGALTMPHSANEVIYTIIGVGLVALGHDLNRRALI